MTLREMFRPHTKYWDCYNDEPLKYDHENKCVKIADKFAIGFAEWYAAKIIDDVSLYYAYSARELLQEFKKEKGL